VHLMEGMWWRSPGPPRRRRWCPFRNPMAPQGEHVASFEVARRRVPASLLPTLARSLAVTVEDLLGVASKPGRRGPAPKLQQKLERLATLPKSRQRFVLDMLDTVLQQAGR
jgi:hypothetical protein